MHRYARHQLEHMEETESLVDVVWLVASAEACTDTYDGTSE